MLMNRDPLSQTVHHSKMDVAALFLKRFPAFALMRLQTSSRAMHDQRRKYRRPRRQGGEEEGQRQLLLYRHAADAGGRARRHVRDLCLLPQGGRHRR